MSILSWEKVTLAFSLLKRSRPSRGIGHSGMYRETASNKSLLSDTPVASKRAFGEVLETVTISEEALASLEFSTEKVGPVSIKKSTSLFPTVIFTQGSLWEISVEAVLPRRDPGPCHSWSLSIIWGISRRGCEQIISISTVSLAL